MSRPFEQSLARWFFEQADEFDIQAGDRYAAEFPNGETAKNTCEAILNQASVKSMQEVTYEGTTQELPTIEIGSTPVQVVQVRRTGNEVTEPYEVSRWYATTIRNVLADRRDDDLEVGLLMIYEAGVGIETLETTYELFTDDGHLPLRNFQNRIRNNYAPLSIPGRAIIKAIDDETASGSHDTLVFPEDPMEDLGPLTTFCKLYDACLREDGDTIPSIIPEIGTYLAEEEFDDEWFEKTESEAELVEQAEQILRHNYQHASRIAQATRVARDAEEELSAYYTEDFIETVVTHRDWTEITRSEAANGELSPGEGEGTSTTGGETTGAGSSGTGPTIDRDPDFESLDVKTEKANVYGSGGGLEGDRNIIAAATQGSFDATIEYDLDVSDEPRSFTDSSGEEVEGIECENHELHISLSGMDPDAPRFFSLKVYVGHKTKRGSPQNQFDIALVPEWFFDAMTDYTYGINVEEEALVVRSGDSVPLNPPSGQDDDRIVKELRDQTQTVTLSEPVQLQPMAPPDVERLQCKVVTSADTPIPVTIEFISEVEEPSRAEIQLPLAFTAATSPKDWADDDLLIDSTVVPDLSTGKFHSPNRGQFEIPDTDRQLLQFEERIVDDATIAQRITEQMEVGTGKLQEESVTGVAADLIDSYTRLFDHFDEQGTVPSTDPWNEETQERVEAVLESFNKSVGSLSEGEASPAFDPYRQLGTIHSAAAEKVWLTPFHPLMLAYGLRLSQWRDELADQEMTAGFRFSRFNAQFSPVGFMPYRWDSNTNSIFSGQLIGNHHLWALYEPLEGPKSKTPDYISDVIADKLEAFSRAFSLLLRLHNERELRINLVNMGDLGPVIVGLYDFFEFIDDYPELNFPNITLQLYGSESQGRALEQFFAIDSSESPLRDKLTSSKSSDEILNQLDRRVTYIHLGEQFDESSMQSAHFTIFRGLLQENSGTGDVGNFPQVTRMDGLLPRDQLKVDTSGGDIISTSGAAFDPCTPDLFSRVGLTVNALEASRRDGSLQSNRSLRKIITASAQNNLPKIWEHSLWVLHVQPKVDLGFYVQSTSEAASISNDTLMIHYSDQYDADSPGFDVITTTDKRDPYLTALQAELNEHPGLDELDPEAVLTHLVAIDGELALNIQQPSKNTMELLGLVGGLAVSAEILATELPEYEWIPISLNEFARHDRRYQSDSEGLLQYFGDGSASDDLCFVGIPEAGDVDELSLKLWVVEAKGGTADIQKGIEQVKGANEKLSELFDPEEPYADTAVLRSEFGDVISRIADRLYHYNVISQDRKQTIDQHADRLLDGAYSIDLLEDANGSPGEVISIQRTLALPEQDLRDGVRVLELPTSVLGLINASPTGDREINAELDTSRLRFESVDESESSQDSEPSGGGAIEPKAGTETKDSQETETDETSQDSEVESTSTGISGDDEHDTETATITDEASTEADGEPTATDESDTTGPTPVSEEPSDTESDSDVSTDTGYEWTETDFEALIESLTEGSEPDLDIDMSRLTTDLKEQFNSLGIDVYEPNPADVSIGPRKIGVNVRPKSGQKIESVFNALNSISVHIQASGTITGLPNPAEGAIRLEIPHGQQQDVYLRQGFEELQSKLLEPLHLPLGVNTENEHIVVDLLEEHHMLIGGATGSGKSNFLGTCICSLAASQPPSRLKLSLLDPKGIDFGRFEELPQVDTYLDTPADCVKYLKSLIDSELEERRGMLQEKGVASVQEFNRLADQNGFDSIPYRVIVIDEFADLIMALSDNKEEFEESVARLAQIGRALGYSVLLATQRPDADIVSGNIKTNFNCRVSFELPSNTDSRVILDQSGAEDLEGAGDMIALTSAGEEYHLQAYRLLPEDANTIRERLNPS